MAVLHHGLYNFTVFFFLVMCGFTTLLFKHLNVCMLNLFTYVLSMPFIHMNN